MTIILIISALSNIGLAIYARHTQRRLRRVQLLFGMYVRKNSPKRTTFPRHNHSSH